MAKYIELEVAVKAFNNFDAGRADSPPCTLLTPEEFAEYLHELPIADVAPVVHARWIPFHSETAGDIQYCSNCKIGNAAKSDFCPHCGAKMDGGDNDATD